MRTQSNMAQDPRLSVSYCRAAPLLCLHGMFKHRPSTCLQSLNFYLTFDRIGEKFLVWTDEDPPLDETLDNVTLYWFTESFPRAIYPYRQFFGTSPTFFHNDTSLYISKPLGYSYFPMELAPVPKSWVAKTGNLVWTRVHDDGGHFAAMERPKYFVQDMEDFIKEVWKK